jgi:hypothetical protein
MKTVSAEELFEKMCPGAHERTFEYLQNCYDNDDEVIEIIIKPWVLISENEDDLELYGFNTEEELISQIKESILEGFTMVQIFNNGVKKDYEMKITIK